MEVIFIRFYVNSWGRASKKETSQIALQGLLKYLCGYASATIAEFTKNTLTGFTSGQDILVMISR